MPGRVGGDGDGLGRRLPAARNRWDRALSAAEVKERNVLVTAVLPGSTDTDMLKGSGWTPEMTPSEVARVVTFLCTEAPLAMSGSLVEMFG